MPFTHSTMLRVRHSVTRRCAMCRSRHASATLKSASSMNAYAVFCPCAWNMGVVGEGFRAFFKVKISFMYALVD